MILSNVLCFFLTISPVALVEIICPHWSSVWYLVLLWKYQPTDCFIVANTAVVAGIQPNITHLGSSVCNCD